MSDGCTDTALALKLRLLLVTTRLALRRLQAVPLESKVIARHAL